MNIKRIWHYMKNYILDKNYRYGINSYLGFYNHMSDQKYISKEFESKVGSAPDLTNPRTFNEKLQWIKLFDRKEIYTVMADKYLVKQYVSGIIGRQHVVPTIGVWENPDDIDFETLPNQFVLKCNHNSGLGMYICKDKSRLEREKVILNLKKGINQNYFLLHREWSYKNIPRRIIAEKYMEDLNVLNNSAYAGFDGLIDYKFYCFNGEPRFLYVGFANIIDGKKRDTITYLTLDWELAPFYRKDHEPIPALPSKPECFEQMLSYARKLSEGIPFVRVDFFLIENNIYFSEFTFTPGAGYSPFYPEEWERTIGDWIILPNN